MTKFASSLPWEPAKLHDKACFWERIEAPLPPLRPRPKGDFIHPRQLSPFPERLVLQFSTEVFLSRYEEIDSSGNDLCTSSTKLSEHGILVEHMVDTEKATTEFREAYDARDTTSSHLKSSKKRFATRSIVQRERKMPPNNKLQENGVSLPCRNRTSMLTTSFSRIAST